MGGLAGRSSASTHGREFRRRLSDQIQRGGPKPRDSTYHRHEVPNALLCVFQHLACKDELQGHNQEFVNTSETTKVRSTHVSHPSLTV